ncbi:MAG TPA: hypothetical protein DCE39_00025 [Planctomycetaceae bacterium]|nr:hypothetical protein [Planctomycetaceae bacterium]
MLAKLENAGLRPVADADRSTWLRRVSFDLAGRVRPGDPRYPGPGSPTRG